MAPLATRLIISLKWLHMKPVTWHTSVSFCCSILMIKLVFPNWIPLEKLLKREECLSYVSVTQAACSSAQPRFLTPHSVQHFHEQGSLPGRHRRHVWEGHNPNSLTPSAKQQHQHSSITFWLGKNQPHPVHSPVIECQLISTWFLMLLCFSIPWRKESATSLALIACSSIIFITMSN